MFWIADSQEITQLISIPTIETWFRAYDSKISGNKLNYIDKLHALTK